MSGWKPHCASCIWGLNNSLNVFYSSRESISQGCWGVWPRCSWNTSSGLPPWKEESSASSTELVLEILRMSSKVFLPLLDYTLRSGRPPFIPTVCSMDLSIASPFRIARQFARIPSCLSPWPQKTPPTLSLWLTEPEGDVSCFWSPTSQPYFVELLPHTVAICKIMTRYLEKFLPTFVFFFQTNLKAFEYDSRWSCLGCTISGRKLKDSVQTVILHSIRSL